MTRPTRIQINPQALIHNVNQIRELAPQSKVMAMVKANAYGHGLGRITQALSGHVDAFGVACLEEAMLLRQFDASTPVVLMEGFFDADELQLIHANAIESVVHSQEQVDFLCHRKLPYPLPVWLKVNTGMNRLGFMPAQVDAVVHQLQSSQAVQQPLRFMTHFADADLAHRPMTRQQIALFQETCGHYQGEKSLANSAAIIQWRQSHADWVRPGIMLYGVSPIAGALGSDFHLQAVMNLASEIIAIQHCQPGDTVGYGSCWACPEAMAIGVVAMGYGDGYPRDAKAGTPVMVDGIRVPLVGRVSMDMLTVDLRLHPSARVGSAVQLWGDQLPIEEVAPWVNSSVYELVCRMKER